MIENSEIPNESIMQVSVEEIVRHKKDDPDTEIDSNDPINESRASFT